MRTPSLIVRILLAVALVLVAGGSLPVAATNLTGTFYHPDGSPVNGKLIFLLSQPARLSDGSAQVVPMVKIFSITNGVLETGAFVYGNDALLPSGTYYVVRLVDSSNNLLFEQKWSIQGTNLNLGTLTPTTTGVVVPDPLIKNATTEQAVEGPVTFSSGLTTFSLTLNGNLNPGSPSSYDLGNNTLPWRELAVETVRTQKGPWYDVTAHGAVCDGSANDATAFSTAISAMPTSGGVLFVPGPCVLNTDVFSSVTKPVHVVLNGATLTVNASTTLPGNMTFEFRHGAQISAGSSVIVNFKGGLEAPRSRIFAGGGTFLMQWESSAAGVQRRPYKVYPEWWGAILDGQTDATAAINSALAAVGSRGGLVHIGGHAFTAGAVNFPALTGRLVIELEAQWNNSVTLQPKGGTTFIGVSGGLQGSFVAVPRATINANSVTAVQLGGSGANGPVAFENIAFASSVNGPVVLITDSTSPSTETANFFFDNCLFNNVNTGASADAVKIDSVFWTWFRRSTFSTQGGAGAASLRVTTSAGLDGGVGLLHVEDAVLVGRGVKFDGSRNAGSVQGNAVFRNVVYEDGNDSMFTFDLTNNSWGNLILERVEIADPASVPYHVEMIGTATGLLHNLVSNVPLLVGGSAARNIENRQTLFSDNDYTGEGVRFDTPEIDWEYFGAKGIDARWLYAGGQFAPSLVPYANPQSINQDPSGWSSFSGSASITQPVTAPDGSSTAGRLSSASGTQNRYTDLSLTLASGDWFLFGGWMRANSATRSFAGGIKLELVTAGFTWDKTLTAPNSSTTIIASANQADTRRYGTAVGWIPVVRIGKVAATGTNPATVRLILEVDNNHTTDFWKPFLIRIPAGTVSDAEIIRLYRAGIVNVSSSAKAGQIAGFDHQTLRMGRYHVGGTALVTNDFALSAGWGSTASAGVASDSRDAGGEVTLTANGSGIAANPTVALTFKDGTWTNAPFCTAGRNDALATAGYFALTTRSATSVTWTFVGTPVAGEAYKLGWLCTGAN